MKKKEKVLFICVHNSARSQMAEAWLNKLCGDFFEAQSAGLEPGSINPLVAQVMREAGIDLAGKKTQRVFDVWKSGQIFQYVIQFAVKPRLRAVRFSRALPPAFTGRSPIRRDWSEPMKRGCIKRVRFATLFARRSNNGAKKFAPGMFRLRLVPGTPLTPRLPLRVKKYVAEFIGTFALVFAGTGAIVIDDVSGGAVTHVGVALTFGLIVLAMIYTVGDISGAHLNPAVTLGFFVARRFPAREISFRTSRANVLAHSPPAASCFFSFQRTEISARRSPQARTRSHSSWNSF